MIESNSRASSRLSTRPTRIGVRNALLRPRVNSSPSAPVPITAPTLTSAMLETVTTRRPAKITGMARGSSTRNNRRSRPKPTAAAEAFTEDGTDRRPSTTLRTSSATE